MSENRRAVPLPNVSNHTEAIVIEGLGLPSGFDDERLLVNVAVLERFRKAAGIGGNRANAVGIGW